MNEFEEKDYDSARSFADSIQTNADNIMDIFNSVDATMDALYGGNWESAGAENANERYNEIRANYEVFYNNVSSMHDHVYKVTEANEEADAAASKRVSGV